jgi:two-component system sensor histidine kinase ResE
VKLKYGIMGKLWLYMTALMVVTLIFAGIVLSHSFSDVYFKIRENELINEGQQLISLMLRGVNPNELLDISKFINAHAVVVDRKGLIKVSSNTVGFNGLAIDGKEFEKVLKGHTLVYKGYTPQFNMPMLTVALPIKTEGEVMGSLILYSPMASIQNSLYNIRRLIMMTVVGAMAISTIVSLFLSKSVSSPLVKMKKVAEGMAQGKFDDKVPVNSEDEIGALAGTINYLSDALRENLNALSQEKNQLQQVLLSMSDGVMTFGIDGQLILANPQAQEMMSGFEGKLDLGVIQPLLQRALRHGDYSQGEIVFNGRTISVRIAPLLEDTTLWGIVAVLQDVTRERRAEIMRREFLGNVSHELRTPLSCLQGYTEALLDGMVPDPEEEKRYLNIILDETLRLRRMVDELLALTKVEEGQLELHKVSTSISAIVERIKNKFITIAAKRNIKIVTELEDDPLWIQADEDGIEQVLTNLVDNAVKHSGEGHAVYISATSQEDGAVLSVRDEGPGLPESDLPFIWDRFYKVDKSRTRSDGGTGLGLSIVRSIIEAHGGKVWAKNCAGGGAAFFVSLPGEPPERHRNHD